MSQESSDLTQFFFETPSEDEVKKYFLRQKRLADIKVLETPVTFEASPDLSASFEMELQQRKQRAEEIKLKMKQEALGLFESPRTSKAESFRQSCLNNTTICVGDNTMQQCSDDSFLAMEKLCENTLHINNVSAELVDLTALEDSFDNNRKTLKPFQSIGEETHLFSVEAPSFMFNNTSLMSPSKCSPLKAVHANRPSTILEVSESNKTGMSSYQTAMTRSEASDYKTANEDSFTKCESIEEGKILKMPKLRSFYDSITRDSLEPTVRVSEVSVMTKDSLNAESYADQSDGTDKSSSGVDSSYDQREEAQEDEEGEGMNDTLERIEFLLAQAEKMQTTPKVIPPSPLTPATTSSGTKSSSKKLQPKSLTIIGSATKNSPRIKLSPVVKTPINKEPTFKRPLQSASKIPQTSSNSKFQHIESPLARYIKHTPGLPLASTARVLPGIGNSPKQFNFRDSDSYANENESANSSYKPSLPFLAKTKSSAVSQVFEQRETQRTPGGAKMQSLIAHTTPTVTVHQGHFKSSQHDRPRAYNLLNDTALSEQSFADLSLISGDVSVQYVEGVKRTMK